MDDSAAAEGAGRGPGDSTGVIEEPCTEAEEDEDGRDGSGPGSFWEPQLHETSDVSEAATKAINTNDFMAWTSLLASRADVKRPSRATGVQGHRAVGGGPPIHHGPGVKLFR